jgi:glucose/mannose transport system substrate-binding protein
LWFNQRVLREAGVAVSGPGYTAEAFGNDLAKVAASGRTSLCLGGKDRFNGAVREHPLGVVGPDGWAKIQDDSSDWRGSQLRQALTRFGQVVSQVDPNAGGLTWDQAAKKLATGE